MTNNIIRAANRFRPSASSERLDEADAIYRRLQSDVKVTMSDRPILAENLGRMLEKEMPEKPKSALQRVFSAAFGNMWESAYKKRHRFLVLPSEATGSGNREGVFCANGRPYLDLAEAISNLSGKLDADERRRTILNLIEGTSLDSRAARKLREEDGGRSELCSAMETVLEQLLAAFDLPRYVDLLSAAPMKLVRGEDGKQILGPAASSSQSIVDKAQPSTEMGELISGVMGQYDEVQLHHLFSEADTDQDRALPGWATPRVLLGYVAQQVDPDAFIELDLKYDEVLDQAEQRLRDRQAAGELTHDERLFREMTSLIESAATAQLNVSDAYQLEDSLWTQHVDTESHHLCVRLLRPVHLFLQVEISTGRPRLAIQCSDSFPTEHGVAPQRNLAKIRAFANFPFAIADNAAWSVMPDSGKIILVRLYDSDLPYTFSEPFHSHILRMLPQENAVQMCLAHFSPQPGHSFVPMVDYASSWYAPVAADTLAHVVLGNIAYADEGRRITDLIIEDAVDRLNQVEEYIGSLQANYSKGISREN